MQGFNALDCQLEDLRKQCFVFVDDPVKEQTTRLMYSAGNHENGPEQERRPCGQVRQRTERLKEERVGDIITLEAGTVRSVKSKASSLST